ncbi:MAG: hypothetical protein LH618_02625, partial [Saprospiraceae bacterium]|nr:hypothetical protein [Saprospiraceae bacterium]
MKRKSLWLMHLLFPVTVVLLFVSKPLFPLLFNPDFAASAALFNIYLLLTASRVLLPNAIMLALGQQYPAGGEQQVDVKERGTGRKIGIEQQRKKRFG